MLEYMEQGSLFSPLVGGLWVIASTSSPRHTVTWDGINWGSLTDAQTFDTEAQAVTEQSAQYRRNIQHNPLAATVWHSAQVVPYPTSTRR